MDSEDLKKLIQGSKEIFEARGGNKFPIKEEKKNNSFCFTISCSFKKYSKRSKIK